MPVVDGKIILIEWETYLIIGHWKDHIVNAVLLHEFGSDLLGEACEGCYTADMMVRLIVHHRYHLHAWIVTGGERYNFSSYPFHKHLTIHVIMVVSCMQIG